MKQINNRPLQTFQLIVNGIKYIVAAATITEATEKLNKLLKK